MAKPSWITVSPASGTGDKSVTCTASDYTGRVNRTGSITIYNPNVHGLSKTIDITQIGKAVFIEAAVQTSNITATTKSVIISGVSNAPSITLTNNGSTGSYVSSYTFKLKDSSANLGSMTPGSAFTIEGDPGKTAAFNFEITATLTENQSESSRNCSITLTVGSSVTKTVTWTQTAGSKSYGNVVIDSFTYSDIPASGGSSTPSLKYSQTWGWNGNTTNGGRLNSGASVSYSISSTADGATISTSSGVVSGVQSQGTTAKARHSVGSVQVVVSLNGQSNREHASVYQAENKITSSTKDTFTISGMSPKITVPKEGGDVNLTATGSYVLKETYSSGSVKPTTVTNATDSKIIIQYSNIANDYITQTSEKLTFKKNNTLSTRMHTLNVTLTYEGAQKAELNVTITQEKGMAYLDVSPATLTFVTGGGSQTISISSNDSWTIS